MNNKWTVNEFKNKIRVEHHSEGEKEKNNVKSYQKKKEKFRVNEIQMRQKQNQKWNHKWN